MPVKKKKAKGKKKKKSSAAKKEEAADTGYDVPEYVDPRKFVTLEICMAEPAIAYALKELTGKSDLINNGDNCRFYHGSSRHHKDRLDTA